MAESAVTFLLKKLSKLVEDESKLLGGARGDFVSIRNELQSMRAFLVAADAMEDSDPELQEWVKQVRDVADDTDAVIDEFTLRLHRPHLHGVSGSLCRIYHQMKNVKFRHQIVSEIQEIKGRVIDIAQRRQRYNYKLGASEHGSSSHAANNSCYDRRSDALWLEEAELVGIDKPRQQLIDRLLDGDSRLKAVSVYGMGGLGKTTLVRKVYENAKVKRQFQNHGWVTFSQSFKNEELLKDLIRQLFNEARQSLPQMMETMDTNRLKEVLREFLRDTKYVLVLDDVWSRDAWDAIKYALPDCDCGSRVLLTTRIGEVASASSIESRGYFYEMKALSPEESWTLFCKKTFHGKDCPQHLKNISENILERCEGLPLAIVVIAGVLALKDQIRVDEWEMANRSLGSEVEGTDIKKILLLSYNGLPYYLKPCLLYLSGFPEDYPIEWTISIRLLVAERFVEQKEGKTLEEIAESYLYDLLNRSLIQVAKREYDGKVKECRIHDLLREVILLKSKNQNLLAISGEGSAALPKKVRRLSIHTTLRNIPRDHCFSQLRSLLIFGVYDPLTESSMPMLFNSCSRLLKTLHLKGASLEIFPGGAVKCFHLTYLSLRGTKVKVLPKTIRNLKNLQTLDLQETYVSELPTEILRLQGLRHLLVSNFGTDRMSFHYVRGFKAPFKIGELRNLQNLLYIEANSVSGHNIVEEIGRLTQLRSLRIVELRREDGVALCSSIAMLSNLQELYVTSSKEDEILDLQSLSPAPQLLQRLRLIGRLEKFPQWIAPLHGLTKLSLMFSKLRGDVDDHVLQSLQHLPSLIELKLTEQAYDGEGLCFNAGGFHRLKYLGLQGLHGLRRVTVEEGAMPLLEDLKIVSCKLMEELPSGIELLSNLNGLYLVNLPDGLTSKLNRRNSQGGDYWKIGHIPEVWIGSWTKDDKWKGSYL